MDQNRSVLGGGEERHQRHSENDGVAGKKWKVLFTSRPTQASSWEVSDLHSFSLPPR